MSGIITPAGWYDAKIDKPNNADPVIGLTSNGYIVIVQYEPKNSIGKWFELRTGETFDNVIYWTDKYYLPRGWHISDDYYEGDNE